MTGFYTYPEHTPTGGGGCARMRGWRHGSKNSSRNRTDGVGSVDYTLRERTDPRSIMGMATGPIAGYPTSTGYISRVMTRYMVPLTRATDLAQQARRDTYGTF